MKRRTCKSVSLHCCHTTLYFLMATRKYLSKRCSLSFLIHIVAIEGCVARSVYHTSKRKERGRSRIDENFTGKCLKSDLQLSSGQKPTFIFHFIYFSLFFSHLSVKKKWESGQRTRKPLCRNGFRLPTFEK